MKCISIYQPWATIIAIGQKRFETRHCQTAYRGPIAIHAATKWNSTLFNLCTIRPFRDVLRDAGYYVSPRTGRAVPMCLQLGCVVAVAELTDCISTNGWSPEPMERAFGDFSPNRFAWQLSNVRRLSDPLPMVGRQGMWGLEVGTMREVESRVKS